MDLLFQAANITPHTTRYVVKVRRKTLKKCHSYSLDIVPFREPPSSGREAISWSESTEICEDGMARIQRILTDSHLIRCPIQDEAEYLQSAENLVASWNMLRGLLQTGRTLSMRARVETLLDDMTQESTLQSQLYAIDELTELHVELCDLEAQVAKANEMMESFGRFYEDYTAGGRKEIACFLEERVRAARKAGMREGVATSAENEQISQVLENIDRSFSDLGDKLKYYKDFWEHVDQSLKSIPDGLPAEDDAQNIQTGLETVQRATEKVSGPRRILKTGTQLVRRASDLKKECVTVLEIQPSVATHLRSTRCNPRSARNTVSPLKSRFSNLANSYSELWVKFAQWAQLIYLLFWFAATTCPSMKRTEDHIAYATLDAENLSLYALPFESAFMAFGRQLLGMEDFWKELQLRAECFSIPKFDETVAAALRNLPECLLLTLRSLQVRFSRDFADHTAFLHSLVLPALQDLEFRRNHLISTPQNAYSLLRAYAGLFARSRFTLRRFAAIHYLITPDLDAILSRMPSLTAFHFFLWDFSGELKLWNIGVLRGLADGTLLPRLEALTFCMHPLESDDVLYALEERMRLGRARRMPPLRGCRR
ncbi:hypothetical protein GGX14DRAFT_575216 [Mycena pura]|uniref:Uncharacterized protein n=1 Tax=Mycena pura TaxID=153505 RepID=A0AAD6Y2L1_9AGAR|nr:hypothetical protein GGX14DRAFT_575216 [Mycena pura]